ncbi:MAG: aconitase X catalytic domain-containing protein [Desulfobacteraceae bacterium]|nr:aconitase X catalytic domain-containing protein [Desulfobacteraceae bacterium]
MINLETEQKEMLRGSMGPGVSKAMEILYAYGQCYDARQMIPVTSVHVAGNFPVLMDEGIEWLEKLAEDGARVSVFTTKNPEMFDLERAEALNVPTFYQVRQKRIHEVLKKLGIIPTYSCHHYLVGNVPKFGDHIAWASSGSQVYANSVIGARSNRDGDHVALAAAITGVIPEWGLHLTKNRKAEVLVDVGRLDLKNFSTADYKALGWQLGKKIGMKIPAFVNLPANIDIEAIKGILYTITVTGATGLVHMVGITPEAPTLEAAFAGPPPKTPDITVSQNEIDAAYKEISSSSEKKVDLVIFGCPQCTIQEIKEITAMLDGRKLNSETRLWICTSRWVKTLCERMGLLDKLNASGADIVCDIGAADGPHLYLREQGVRVIAVNSAKASYYAHNLFGMETWFGTTRQCVETAVSGKWEGKNHEN